MRKKIINSVYNQRGEKVSEKVRNYITISLLDFSVRI